jgi:hypothetical protein
MHVRPAAERAERRARAAEREKERLAYLERVRRDVLLARGDDAPERGGRRGT